MPSPDCTEVAKASARGGGRSGCGISSKGIEASSEISGAGFDGSDVLAQRLKVLTDRGADVVDSQLKHGQGGRIVVAGRRLCSCDETGSRKYSCGAAAEPARGETTAAAGRVDQIQLRPSIPSPGIVSARGEPGVDWRSGTWDRMHRPLR